MVCSSFNINGFVQVWGAVILTVIGITFATVSGLGSDSHGLGDHIEWSPLDTGIELAKESNKPLMLIIHKSWCGACKILKPKFQDSKEIAALSKRFVMVNTLDNDEPEGDVYQPDGSYIPRILFFDPNGELLKDIIHEGGNPDYKYYYNDADSILRSMEKVISQISKGEEDKYTDEAAETTTEKQDSKNETNANRIEL